MHAAGDLGAIDPKYDVAVSSAVGALDFIVVDSTVTAQKCVELLRRQKLGVATFLILEKQQHLAGQMSKAASPPEGASPDATCLHDFLQRQRALIRICDQRLR